MGKFFFYFKRIKVMEYFKVWKRKGIFYSLEIKNKYIGKLVSSSYSRIFYRVEKVV